MKHTPGPWNYRPAKNVMSNRSRERPDLFDLPAEVTNADDTEKIKVGGITVEGDANARLIAAAPELLAALKDLNGYLNAVANQLPVRELSAVLDKISRSADAIAKATQ